MMQKYKYVFIFLQCNSVHEGLTANVALWDLVRNGILLAVDKAPSLCGIPVVADWWPQPDSAIDVKENHLGLSHIHVYLI